ncbi:MAG: PAS domain-containing protein, partial [Treponema sp.]|nr:PAS domain-containing protein [Treponema sp.]
PDNRLTWSKEFRHMLGFTDEADFPNVLSSWSNRLHSDDRERTLNAFAAHMTDRSGKTPYDLEYRLMLKNGEYRHFRAFGTTMRDSSGIPLRVAGALQDIHSEKTQGEVLARTREENDLRLAQLNAVAKAAKIGLWDMWIIKDDPINPVNAFRWSNEFRQLLGYSNKDDFPDVFSSWSSRIHPDDFDMVMSSFEKHVLDGTGQTPYDLEYRVYKKNGDCIHIRDFGNIIRDENGNSVRAAGAIEDITERILTQEALKEALYESNKARDYTTNILNKSGAMIYVSDLKTDKILFISDYMKRHFGIEGDVTGQPCYKVLQKGMTERCDFCPCHKLDKEPDKVIVWETYNTMTNSYNLNTDRYIDWPGGKKAHIQYAVDLTEIKQAQEKLEQREIMLEALNKMAVAFLSQSNKTFDALMTNEVGLFTDVMNLDRLSVWRNSIKPDGLHSSQIYRWEKASGGTTVPLDTLADVTYAQFAPNWEKTLSDGESINGPAGLMLEHEAATLKKFGTVSAFITPVFINNDFWGIVLFEDCHNERCFDNESAEIMRSAAFLFANAVMRSEMERELARAEERTKLMLNTSPYGCNIWDQNLNLIDCNEAIVNLYGLKSKQEYLERFFEYSPEYQPNGKNSNDEAKRFVTRAFTEGSITFEWMHRKADGTPLPAEITLERVNYGNGYVVAGYTRDLREHNRMMDALNRREKMLSALNQMSVLLLSHENETFSDTMNKGLKPITESAGVDRIAVYKRLGKEETRLGQVYLWYGETIPLEEELIVLPENPPVLRWLEILRSGDGINEDVSKMPKDAAAFLRLFGVKAIYFVPIFMKGEFWGVVTLEDHTHHRTFDEDCLDLLQSAAHLCASVIMRTEMERDVAEANERSKLLLDTTPLCCQLWDKNNRMIDCNEEAVNLFGMENKQEFLEDFYKFSPEYQLNGRRTDELVVELLDEAFTKGRGTFDWVYQMSDGTLMPAQGTLARIKYKDDYAVAVYTRDMREHNRMMKDIEYRDSMLRTLNHTANLLNNADIESFENNLHQSMK